MDHIALARTYINKKEKPGNSGFEDPQFEADMRKYGEWLPSYPWCCCFAQMVFRKAYPELSDKLKTLFDPSTRKTFENFKAAGYQISQKPFPGALVIWAEYTGGKCQYTGHAGICTVAIDDISFHACEGNTAVSGSRNGDRVLEQGNRNTKIKANGLNVLGFVKVV